MGYTISIPNKASEEAIEKRLTIESEDAGRLYDKIKEEENTTVLLLKLVNLYHSEHVIEIDDRVYYYISNNKDNENNIKYCETLLAQQYTDSIAVTIIDSDC